MRGLHSANFANVHLLKIKTVPIQFNSTVINLKSNSRSPLKDNREQLYTDWVLNTSTLSSQDLNPCFYSFSSRSCFTV